MTTVRTDSSLGFQRTSLSRPYTKLLDDPDCGDRPPSGGLFVIPAPASAPGNEQDRRISVCERVRGYLFESLASGQVSLDGAARRLGTSSRSLRRHLKAEGTTFKVLLVDVRTVLGKRYLANAHLTISEVSSRLGFSDPSPFQRFFRRTMGLTPSHFRNRWSDASASARLVPVPPILTPR